MAQGRLNAIQTLTATIGFDVYTKAEADAKFATKESVYTKQETNDLLDGKADKATTLSGYGITDAYTKTQTDNLLNGKADADSVYTKSEIDTKIPNSVGSATKPTYVNGGVLTECTYELNKTVPANAVFTDTTYTAGNGLNLSGTSFSAKAGTNVTVDGNGINVNGNGAVASANTGLINGGTAYTELRPTLDGTWVKNAQTTGVNLQKLEGGLEYLYGLLSKQYEQLKKYVNGNYYDYDTDTDAKYVKNVPANVMPYASLNALGGKTVVWNQIVQNGDFATVSLWNHSNASFSVSDNVATTTITTVSSATQISKVEAAVPTVIGHKYCAICDVNPVKATTCRFQYNSVATGISNVDIPANTWTRVVNLYTCTNNVGTLLYYNVNSALAVGDTVQFKNYMLFDLTLMFGAGNEPTTVAEFQQMFPASYYSYNAGTLLSAGVTEVKSVGKNLVGWQTSSLPTDTGTGNTGKQLWTMGTYVVGMSISNYYRPNNVTDVTVSGNTISFKSTNTAYGIALPFPCEPSTDYKLSGTVNISTSSVFVAWYQHDGTYLSTTGDIASSMSATSPANAMQGLVVMRAKSTDTLVTYNNMQVEKGTTATAYSPYQEHSYPIPVSVQLIEGYGWSAGRYYNYIDFDRKVFVQRVGSIDLAIANMNNSESYPGWTSSGIKALIGAGINTQIINSLCVMQNTKAFNANTVGGNDIVFLPSAVYGLTQSQWLANYPSLVLRFYFPLATPIETNILAYLDEENYIEVEAGGTITFENSNGDDYRIPVPSSETYMIDLSV